MTLSLSEREEVYDVLERLFANNERITAAPIIEAVVQAGLPAPDLVDDDGTGKVGSEIYTRQMLDLARALKAMGK